MIKILQFFYSSFSSSVLHPNPNYQKETAKVSGTIWELKIKGYDENIFLGIMTKQEGGK